MRDGSDTPKNSPISRATSGRDGSDGWAPKLSETQASIRSLGVRPGENTEGILVQLGFGPDEIDRLRAQGSVE